MCESEERIHFARQIFVYYDDIYRIFVNVVCEHHTALDLTQIVMIRAWEKFYTLKDPDKSKAWVKAIAKNVLREHMRKKKLYLKRGERVFLSEVEKIELTMIESDILYAITKKESISTVFQALDLLESRYSNIIRENVIGGISLKDIAKSRKMKPATVRAYYSQGMRKLREIYNILEEGGSYNGQKKK